MQPSRQPALFGLRNRIRQRARMWFDHDLFLQGTSPAIRRLEEEMLRAPEGWPLVLLAEPGSGAAEWLLAFHIAATSEPQPLRLVSMSPPAEDVGMKIRKILSKRTPSTLALLRLDLLTESGRSELPALQSTRHRILASACPTDGGGDGTFRTGLDDVLWQSFPTRLHLPPLRDRTEDIEPILQYFLKRYGFPTPLELSPEVMERCLAYRWPGNERQLSKFALRLAAEFGEGPVGMEQIARVVPEILHDSSDRQIHPALSRAVRFIRNHYTRQISLGDVAKASFSSPSHLSHLFRTELQTTFSSFLSGLRLVRAKRLLRKQAERTLSALAQDAGFSSLRQMERHFQQRLGESPTAYRRRIRRKEQRI